MGYPLAIVRMKKEFLSELPLITGEIAENPLAGPFDGRTRARLAFALRNIPYAGKHENGVRDTFEIEAPGAGRLELWLTPDGHLLLDSQAGLELVLAVFLELERVCPDIAIEDPQRGVLHSPESFEESFSLAKHQPRVVKPRVGNKETPSAGVLGIAPIRTPA